MLVLLVTVNACQPDLKVEDNISVDKDQLDDFIFQTIRETNQPFDWNQMDDETLYKGLLVTDGILVVGDAAGFGLNMIITVRGMEYAIASGAMAAETIKEAKKKGDFSARSLAYYEDLLRKSFLLKELETFRNALPILKNPRWFNLYPQAICQLYEKLMWVDENPKPRLFSTAYGELRKSIFSLQGIKDILSLRRI